MIYSVILLALIVLIVNYTPSSANGFFEPVNGKTVYCTAKFEVLWVDFLISTGFNALCLIYFWIEFLLELIFHWIFCLVQFFNGCSSRYNFHLTDLFRYNSPNAKDPAFKLCHFQNGENVAGAGLFGIYNIPVESGELVCLKTTNLVDFSIFLFFSLPLKYLSFFVSSEYLG